jgi:hypothetical protein
MTDFQKVKVLDSRLAVTDAVKYQVSKGGQNVTCAQFNAISQTTSSHTYNIQVPSEQTLIDRRVMWQSTIEFVVSGVPKLGEYLVNYGLTEAFAPFPLHELCSVMTATINNNSVSINIRDVLPAILRCNDIRELNAYNGMTPVQFDTYKSYADAVGANNNPLGSWVNVADNDLIPRGAHPVLSITGNTIGDGVATRTVTIQAQFTEPLLLSPLIFANPQSNAQAFYGIQNLNFVFNIGDTKRFWRTAKAITDAQQYNSAPYSVTLSSFTNSRLLFNFLTPHPSDALVNPRNVVPYYELPRYLTTSQTSISAGQSSNLTTSTLQLNQIPDKLMVMVRKPMSSQLWDDSDSCMVINSVSINFNNQSGILASAQIQDLYRYSRDAGSNQNWYEFSGQAFRNSVAGGNYSPSVPNGYRLWTSGSFLMLDFAQAIQLTEDFYAPGSLGNFNLQLNLNVTNNSDEAIAPEICLITMNSGLFVCERGQSSVFTGILTKQDVLDASQMRPYTRGDVRRMVGGSFLDTLKDIGSALGNVALNVAPKLIERAVGLGASGGGASGGALGMGLSGGEMMDGDGISGGRRLARHMKR